MDTINIPGSMNISKQYAWRPVVITTRSSLKVCEDWLLERVDVEKYTVIFNFLLLPDWFDYNHLYVFWKGLYQQEYKDLRKGLEAGLSKQQISNVFHSQEALGNISPLIAIGKYSGVRNGEIRADFYDDCQNSPDPSAS